MAHCGELPVNRPRRFDVSTLIASCCHPLRRAIAPPPNSSPPSGRTATRRHLDSLRLHFLRNVFAVIANDSAEMVAAPIRTVFTQPTAEAVRAGLNTVANMLGRQFPQTGPCC